LHKKSGIPPTQVGGLFIHGLYKPDEANAGNPTDAVGGLFISDLEEEATLTFQELFYLQADKQARLDTNHPPTASVGLKIVCAKPLKP
jgi:hypothetical protein